MTEAPRPPVSRILVTCDTSPLGTAALDSALALARRLDSEITGLFVEDINLLRMAQLPFAREYGLASAAVRRIDTVDVERSLRRQADAMRDSLSRAAQAVRVRWSFQVVRGAPLESVLEAMNESDLAVLGWMGAFAMAPGAGAAVQATGAGWPQPAQPVVTIYDDTAASDRALATAQALALAHHTGLVVLLIADDAAAAEHLRGRAEAQLQGGRVGARFQVLRERDSVAIRKAVQSNHAATLLWHGAQTAAERKSLSTLVDALKCPVVLVR